MGTVLTPPSPPAGSLWTPLLAPAIWVAHFLTCYVTAALACGRWSSAVAAGRARVIVAVATVVAMTTIAGCLMAALRRRRDAPPLTRLDDDSPEGRRHFLAAATVLLALLSLVGALFVAAATAMVPVCA